MVMVYGPPGWRAFIDNVAWVGTGPAERLHHPIQRTVSSNGGTRCAKPIGWVALIGAIEGHAADDHAVFVNRKHRPQDVPPGGWGGLGDRCNRVRRGREHEVREPDATVHDAVGPESYVAGDYDQVRCAEKAKVLVRLTQ